MYCNEYHMLSEATSYSLSLQLIKCHLWSLSHVRRFSEEREKNVARESVLCYQEKSKRTNQHLFYTWSIIYNFFLHVLFFLVYMFNFIPNLFVTEIIKITCCLYLWWMCGFSGLLVGYSQSCVGIASIIWSSALGKLHSTEHGLMSYQRHPFHLAVLTPRPSCSFGQLLVLFSCLHCQCLCSRSCFFFFLSSCLGFWSYLFFSFLSTI